MSIPEPTAEQLRLLEDEAVQFTRELIRIDSTNYGGDDPAAWGPVEPEVADYITERLREVGLEPEVHETAPGRPNVFVRIPGEDAERGGLILHGHMDVVPARAEDWSVDPFAAEIRDGMIYGRGAVDMKDMVAMLLALARHLARTGATPPRNLMFAFFADEENGSVWGSRWLADHQPELFARYSDAISEVGGYSITLPERETGKDVRAYLLQTSERGLVWGRLRAHGRAGHGSVPNDENAIVRLARAITAIDDHVFPFEFVASVRDLFDGVTEITGQGWDAEDIEPFLPLLGGARQFVRGALRDSANLTMLDSGYKVNVIPQTAEAGIDLRYLPGHRESLLSLIDELIGEHVELIIDVEGNDADARRDGPFVEAMTAAVQAEDPGSHVLPYCLSAGTDNKVLATLGINGYGFVPLQLPPDLDFAPLFHGIDERVPVEAVRFGARVLLRLARDC